MTYVDKPHSQRYTGRGLGWRKKTVTKLQARRIARYWAGLIVGATLDDGWSPDDLVERFGEEGVRMIQDAMVDVGMWLRETGDPDGRPQ